MIRKISRSLESRSSEASIISSDSYVNSFGEASVVHFLSHPPTPENGLVRKELVLVNNGVEHLDR